jgi:hypothetical protein
MTLAELKSKIVWKDQESDRGQSVGKTGDVFTNCNVLILRQSKNGAERATVLFEDKATKRITNITCSLALTSYVRSGEITEGHIKALPLFHSDEKGFFVGLGSQFIDFDAVKEEAFKRDLSISTLEASAAL